MNMPERKTMKELISSLIDKDVKIPNYSICGKCSRCGECCSNILPVSQSEIDVIQKYVIGHKIRPQKQMLVMQNRLSCPYYDGKKCLIYEVRPLICREFYCYKKPDMEMASKFMEEEHYPIDMWAVANAIDKYFRS